MKPRRNEILAAVDLALKNGTPIPLETELEALRFHLEDDPSRLDLKRKRHAEAVLTTVPSHMS